MTQEEKALLQDLCSRLPYGVKVWYKYYSDNVTSRFATSIRLVDGKIALSSKFNREGDWYPVEEANELLIKPYLRPMSSMTEDEREEFNHLYYNVPVVRDSENAYRDIKILEWMHIDWYNAHHFDYRGLIPLGLAIEAPKNMYQI